MSIDRFGPRAGQCWSGSESGYWESAHRPSGRGTCQHWDGRAGAYCLAVDGTRLYAQGVRCPLHTPARLHGAPEPDELLEQTTTHPHFTIGEAA